MHEMFAEAVHFEINVLLVCCKAIGYFCFTELNQRSQSFDYGYSKNDKEALIDGSVLQTREGGNKMQQ